MTTRALASRQNQIAFVTITSREGFGLAQPVSIGIAEIVFWFLQTAWAMLAALMIRELVILWFRFAPAVVFYDVPWSYVIIALSGGRIRL